MDLSGRLLVTPVREEQRQPNVYVAPAFAGRSAGPLLADGAALALSALKAELAAVYLSPSPDTPPVLAAYAAAAGAPVQIAVTWPESMIAALSADSGEPFIVEDVGTLQPGPRAVAEQANIGAFLSCPIGSSEQSILGALDVYYREPRALTRAERDLAMGAARQLLHAACLARGESLADIGPGRLSLVENSERPTPEFVLRLHDEARSARQAKSDFLAMMSHELRTPLNAVLGYTGLLADEIPGPLNEAQHLQVVRVQESARDLLELIEQMLNLVGDAANSAADLRHDEVGIDELLVELRELLGPSAQRRGIALALSRGTEVNLVRTDGSKLRQVLVNLLSNALNFTDKGEASLIVRQSADRVLFDVRDTGLGIAPEHLERIFEPFWQADAARTRRASGAGVGLSVVRRLARQLGGDVAVASTPGAGSVFSFWIPLDTV